MSSSLAIVHDGCHGGETAQSTQEQQTRHRAGEGNGGGVCYTHWQKPHIGMGCVSFRFPFLLLNASTFFDSDLMNFYKKLMNLFLKIDEVLQIWWTFLKNQWKFSKYDNVFYNWWTFFEIRWTFFQNQSTFFEIADFLKINNLFFRNR